MAFIRTWEPTAPEAAIPQAEAVGIPPWQRTNAVTGPQPLAQSGTAHTPGQTAVLPAVDWRVAALVGLPGVLVLATLAGSALALRRLRGA